MELYAKHPVNIARRETGLNPATQVWLWGQGHAPNMPKFADRFGVKNAAMITGVDLLRGLAVLLGWDVIEVDGMTSFHDTNYIGQGIATAAALDKYDLVFSHIEAPDEASHQADWKTKVEAIEHIDQYVVGPVLEKLRDVPRMADHGAAGPSDQYRHEKTRLRADALLHGRDAGEEPGAEAV